jgi:hypothetical protein
MNECVPAIDGDFWVCQSCGFRLKKQPHHAKPPRRECRSVVPFDARTPTTCKHRGGHIGEQECETCQGRTRIKLFVCEIYGQCSIGKALPGIATCASCPDYSPSKRDDDPDGGRAG